MLAQQCSSPATSRAARVKLDLGGGQTPRKRFTNVDVWPGADVVHDLSVAPWPFADDSVDLAFSSHLVEHLDGDGWITFVNELHRVLKPGAKALVTHPYLRSSRAFQDPTHKSFLDENRWMYCQQDWLQDIGLGHYPVTADFDVNIRATFYDPVGMNRLSQEAQAQRIQHDWNVISDLLVWLTKKEN